MPTAEIKLTHNFPKLLMQGIDLDDIPEPFTDMFRNHVRNLEKMQTEIVTRFNSLVDGYNGLPDAEDWVRADVDDDVVGTLTFTNADAIILNNVSAIQAKDIGGTARDILSLDASDNLKIGSNNQDHTYIYTGGATYLNSGQWDGYFNGGQVSGDFRINAYGTNGDIELNSQGTGYIKFHVGGASPVSGWNPATGVAWHGNGTAALPSMSFWSDSNTGFYRYGADDIGVSLAGSAQWVFNSDGALYGEDLGAVVFDSSGDGIDLDATNGYIAGKRDVNAHIFYANATVAGSSMGFAAWYVRGTAIGDIDTINASTVRYNTFTGAHYSQLQGNNLGVDKFPVIAIGTICSSVPELMENSIIEWDVPHRESVKKRRQKIVGSYSAGSKLNHKLDETDKTGLTGTHIEATVIDDGITNDRLPKYKISDVKADKNVYGVYAGHYGDETLNESQKRHNCSIESLGASRILVTGACKDGDLIQSKGDGTGEVQPDDIIRSCTVAKIRIGAPTAMADEVNLLPCTVLCG